MAGPLVLTAMYFPPPCWCLSACTLGKFKVHLTCNQSESTRSDLVSLGLGPFFVMAPKDELLASASFRASEVCLCF